MLPMNNPAPFGRLAGLHGLADVSLRSLVQWGPHLKLDHDNLDAQHEAIFALAMDIADAWQRRGNLEDLRHLAGKLDHMLRAHFRYEERELHMQDYPKLDEHMAEHRAILEELHGIRQQLARMHPGQQDAAPGLLLHNFVLGVAIGHINHSDMDYGRHLQTQQRQASVASADCPFCSSNRTTTVEIDEGRWATHCRVCNSLGPNASSPAEAAARWDIHAQAVTP